MKNLKLELVALLMGAGALFAFADRQDSGIKGKVTPAYAAAQAWAISGTDTLKSEIHGAGDFAFANAKAGTWRVLIEAKPPYRNASKDNITVSEGQITDIGEIKLAR